MTLLLLGLAELEYRPPEVLDVLANHLTLLTHPTPESLATTIYALARLRCCDVALVRRLARDAASPTYLPRFTDRELATVVYSLVRMGCRSHVVLATIVGEASRPKRLRSYSDHSLANLLYALSISDLRARGLDVFQDAFLHNQRLQTCRAQDIVSLMHSFRRRPRLDERFLAPIAASVIQKRRLEEWTPSDAAEILFGFAVCSFPDASLLQPLVQKLISSEAANGLDTHQVADAVYSVATLGLPMPEAFSARLQNPSWLKSFAQVSMVRVLTGLSRSSPREEGLDGICAQEALSPRRLRLYSCNELTQVAEALARMDLRRRRFVAPLENAILEGEKFRRCAPGEIAALTLALGDLSLRGRSSLATLFAHLLTQEIVQRLPLRTVCDLLSCAGRLEIRDEKWTDDVATLIQRPSKRDGVQENIVAVVSSLCQAHYRGDLWSFLLSQLKEQLLQNQQPLRTQIQLLSSVAENLPNLTRELRDSQLLELMLKEQSLSALQDLSDTELCAMAGSLSVLSYVTDLWTVALCDQAWDRMHKKQLKHVELIRFVAALMEMCFRLKISHKLYAMVESHLMQLQETIAEDRSFCVAPYLSHELLISFLRWSGVEGTLTNDLFRIGLNLMTALERESVSASKTCLAGLFPCLLYVQKFGYRPETNAQSRILRRSMEACIEQQVSLSSASPHRVDEAVNLAEDVMKMKLRKSALLDDLHMTVDLLDRMNKTVAIFLEPCSGLDYSGTMETGEIKLKRALLEHRGYKVVTANAAAFDVMSLEEKHQWLLESFAPESTL